MKLSRRERISLISLLAALAALAMDKLLLSEPQAADAALYNGSPTAPSAGREAPPDNPAPTYSGDAPPFAAVAPDVFSWTRIPNAAPAARPALGDASPSPESAAETFRSTHTLRATLLGPHSMALIDDRAYRIGDTVDGFMLESISESEVVFVSDTQRVTLRAAPAWRGKAP